ncbi:presqualene diphosphate synthase HpnD [Mesorhizobium sp. BAC0120]|uniref:presqualene diphosphate synthase HpnD n=1 Tax=Mesorhizobium sp. BAC0120 TaxID=3090670 RepID=UPI00298C8765|nr:presqualene diphosphate synthase HpnD [Mesorhizobium sp. BAC0120]MDW6026153.1 presqualene diphosphate synthase HpnD [Mesorhizobium sp. BAC0120]
MMIDSGLPSSEAARRASGSSFYAAMRILPQPQRQAMFEIYSFCRAVDDIADGYQADSEIRLEQLQHWRSQIDAVYAGKPLSNLRQLADAVSTFDLRREDFLAIIEGMRMDVVSAMRAPDLSTLDIYCDRVACAVGRLSVRVFGMEENAGIALAHHLGRALQLTNILRDLDEDATIGRLYLPREALDDAGITTSDPLTVLSDPAIDKACLMIAARAHQHFTQAEMIMARSPRRIVRTPRSMAAAYRMMLNRLTARGWRAPRAPVRLRPRQLLWIVLRYVV